MRVFCPKCKKDYEQTGKMQLGQHITISEITNLFGIEMCNECWKKVFEKVTEIAFKEKILRE